MSDVPAKLAKQFVERYSGDTVQGPGAPVGRVDESLLESWFGRAIRMASEKPHDKRQKGNG